MDRSAELKSLFYSHLLSAVRGNDYRYPHLPETIPDNTPNLLLEGQTQFLSRAINLYRGLSIPSNESVAGYVSVLPSIETYEKSAQRAPKSSITALVESVCSDINIDMIISQIIDRFDQEAEKERDIASGLLAKLLGLTPSSASPPRRLQVGVEYRIRFSNKDGDINAVNESLIQLAYAFSIMEDGGGGVVKLIHAVQSRLNNGDFENLNQIPVGPLTQPSTSCEISWCARSIRLVAKGDLPCMISQFVESNTHINSAA